MEITCYFLFASVRLVTREPERTASGCPEEQGAGGGGGGGGVGGKRGRGAEFTELREPGETEKKVMKFCTRNGTKRQKV